MGSRTWISKRRRSSESSVQRRGEHAHGIQGRREEHRKNEVQLRRHQPPPDPRSRSERRRASTDNRRTRSNEFDSDNIDDGPSSSLDFGRPRAQREGEAAAGNPHDQEIHRSPSLVVSHHPHLGHPSSYSLSHPAGLLPSFYHSFSPIDPLLLRLRRTLSSGFLPSRSRSHRRRISPLTEDGVGRLPRQARRLSANISRGAVHLPTRGWRSSIQQFQRRSRQPSNQRRRQHSTRERTTVEHDEHARNHGSDRYESNLWISSFVYLHSSIGPPPTSRRYNFETSTSSRSTNPFPIRPRRSSSREDQDASVSYRREVRSRCGSVEAGEGQG